MKSGMGLKDRIWSFIKRSLVGRIFPPLFRALRTFFFEWLLVFILAVFVILGFISLPLSVWWQSENSKNQIKHIPVDTQTTLTVVYPAMLLVEDKPAQISFSVQEPLTQPLTITVNLSCKFLLATSSQTYCDSGPVITFQPLVSRVQTQTLQIANARLEAISKEEKIPFQLSNGAQDYLSMSVEGTLRAALRGFFSNSLTLIITGILSAVGLLYNQFEKRREAEEKKEKEGKERAIQEKDAFREWMRQGRINRAEEIYKKLEASGLVRYLESDDWNIMSRLLDLARGRSPDWKIETIPEIWLNEIAGALLFAFNNGYAKDQKLRGVLRDLSTKELSADLKSAINDALGVPDQYRLWPTPPALKPEVTLLNVPYALPGVNPFYFERAEDDEPFLFPSMFWSEHDLYRRINRTNKTEIIVGEDGVGKTAMALALGKYLHDKETLACYLSGLPEEREIRSALTNRLLDFVCYHPTMLRGFGRNQLSLLARLLTSTLDAQIVLATLENTPFQEMEYVQQGKDENEKQKRINLLRAQLRLLEDAIVSLPIDKPLSDCDWAAALGQCALSLGFKLPVRIVIDANNKQCAEWLNLVILPRVAQWRTLGIITIILIPVPLHQSIGDSNWLGFSEYKWDIPLLTQMLDHRFNTMMETRGSHLKRPAIIGDEFWNLMISGTKNNPRAFFRLWNRMLKLAPPEQWSESLLNQALE